VEEIYIGQAVYMGRPGHLPDVVCHPVVCMVVLFQHTLLRSLCDATRTVM